MRISRRALVALFGATVMLLTMAGVALADSPNPKTIQAVVNGNTVTLTGA